MGFANMNRLPVLLLCALTFACNGGDSQPTPPPPAAPTTNLSPDTTAPFLMLTQAWFTWESDKSGKRRPKPGPARLVMLQQRQGRWHSETLEDPQSRVFHKAVCMGEKDGERRLLTIGGTDAHLKTWRKKADGWSGQSLWNPTFGGKWDRLRDLEVGDVDNDGIEELVIATHDQGVVAVGKANLNKFVPQEIFRKPNTFIHEIEVGDVNGDGKREFYATPSEPNRAEHSQGGGVIVFTHQSDGNYKSQWVAQYPKRHAKEILVADTNLDGRDELYVSLEARVEARNGKKVVLQPLEIREYRQNDKGRWQGHTIAKLERGVQARVLLAGDLSGSGAQDIIVTTLKDGVWRLQRPSDGTAWQQQQIDPQSSGFEHAAAIIDLDQDGHNELYVAADDQDEVRRYIWKDGAFARETIFRLGKSDLTWSIEPCF